MLHLLLSSFHLAGFFGQVMIIPPKHELSMHVTYSAFCKTFLNVQTKITAFRMLSHCLHVKQSNQTFPSPFSLPPHLHVLLQTKGHELWWQPLRRSGKVLVFGMLYHKPNLLFHCKRKFLKFNFLIKFIFNDQTLSNIMYTCTQQEFLLRKKKPKNLWKESWSK